MDPQLLRDLRDLVITSLPTLFLFFFLYIYLRKFFFSRIERVLDERRQATTGTIKAADESFKRAEAKTAEYEEKIRQARTEIYKEQEAVRRRWREDQTAALSEARGNVEAAIRESRASLAAQTLEAKASLGAESEALAEQITRSILTGRAN